MNSLRYHASSNFLRQLEEASTIAARTLQEIRQRLDEIGVKHHLVHDELTVESTPETAPLIDAILNAPMITLHQFKNVIENCPVDGFSPQGLVGWVTISGIQICSKCSARIIARGCGHFLRGSRDVWENDAHAPSFSGCQLCSVPPTNSGEPGDAQGRVGGSPGAPQGPGAPDDSPGSGSAVGHDQAVG
jgi:hypothetical protein